MIIEVVATETIEAIRVTIMREVQDMVAGKDRDLEVGIGMTTET